MLQGRLYLRMHRKVNDPFYRKGFKRSGLIKRTTSFFLQPFVLFWFYYFIGPFLTLDKIRFIYTGQNLFSETELIPFLLRHGIAYLSLLPLIIFCANLNLLSSGKIYRIKPKVFSIIPYVIFSVIFLFLVYSIFDFSKYYFLTNIAKARIYIDWLDGYRLMPMLLLGLMIGQLFFGPSYYILLAIPSFIIDILLSRRHLLVIFLYPLIRRLKIKGIFILVLIIGIVTSVRDGLDHIATSTNSVMNSVFSESYMIFLSSTNHARCSISFNSVNDIYHFERFTEYCRILQSAAGGFSARFQYDIVFGILSIVFYSLIFWSVLRVFSRSILPMFRDVLGVVIFVSLFIAYRDDLGNSLSYLLQYVLVLFFTSYMVKSFRRSRRHVK
jgi:hypothetical protein